MKPIITVRTYNIEEFNNALLELDFGLTTIFTHTTALHDISLTAFKVTDREVRVVTTVVSEESAQQYRKAEADAEGHTFITGVVQIGYDKIRFEG